MEQINFDLTKMYADDAAIAADTQRLKDGIEDLKALQEQKQEKTYDILDLLQRLSRTASKLLNYAHMKRDVDTRDNKAQQLYLELESLYYDYVSAASFMDPYLVTLSEEDWDALKSHHSYEEYALYFERLKRRKAHTLSESEEYLLGLTSQMGDTAESAFYNLSYADMEFPILEQSPDQERLTHSNYSTILESDNRALRKEAFEAMYGTYDRYKNTYAATLYGAVKNLVLSAKARKYPSAIEEALFPDNVDIRVYNALIDSVHDALPSMYRYVEKKKEKLEVEELHLYDIYKPVVNNSGRTYRYEEAQEILLNAFAPLGEEYCGIVRKAFEENWIDVYPAPGKRSGAYSSGCYDSDPYILMNYTGNLNSVFTLAHELGHSVHSYYSRKNNPYLYSRYTIFVAEVASTTNELLLLSYLKEHAQTEEEQQYLHNYYLDQFRTTVFRQTMFAEFERDMHQKVERGEALTADVFQEYYYALNEKYFGDNMVIDEQIALEWTRIPHFYNNFYVYKYATGFSAACILSAALLSDSDDAVERYLHFLKDGGRHFPIDQLRSAGADMEKKETVDAALNLFAHAVDVW